MTMHKYVKRQSWGLKEYRHQYSFFFSLIFSVREEGKNVLMITQNGENFVIIDVAIAVK